MSRCIHCTRCVRFGQEVAGVMELGMLGRGEHSEITSFVGKTVDSEVSGNMIDLCPVGALTCKPFRYSARTWELSRRKSVSPHDSLGTNLIVQVKGGKVMRVLPLENEEINECWISDKDRFSYEALDNDDRLTKPMLKQGGVWPETDWQTALEYVAHGLRNIKHEHGADSIAAVPPPTRRWKNCTCWTRPCAASVPKTSTSACARPTSPSTARSRHGWACRLPTVLGRSARFVIGSFLRKDHPLVATRLRAAVKNGAKLSVLHASDDDLLIPTANKIIAAPSDWLAALVGHRVAVAGAKDVAAPAGFDNMQAIGRRQRVAAA